MESVFARSGLFCHLRCSMTKSNHVRRSGETHAAVTPNLKLAGWLSMTNAILTIPIFAMSLFLASQSGSAAKLLAMILAGVSFILFIFIFLSLKGLLNTRFGFHDTDTLYHHVHLGECRVISASLSGTLPTLKSWQRLFHLLSSY